MEFDVTQQATALAATYVSSALRGFQYKNIIGGHMRLVTVNAYLIAFAEIAFVGMAAKNGWIIALAAGTGAALGIWTSIVLHNFIFKKSV